MAGPGREVICSAARATWSAISCGPGERADQPVARVPRAPPGWWGSRMTGRESAWDRISRSRPAGRPHDLYQVVDRLVGARYGSLAGGQRHEPVDQRRARDPVEPHRASGAAARRSYLVAPGGFGKVRGWSQHHLSVGWLWALRPGSATRWPPAGTALRPVHAQLASGVVRPWDRRSVVAGAGPVPAPPGASRVSDVPLFLLGLD